jgi:hypothetical protein
MRMIVRRVSFMFDRVHVGRGRAREVAMDVLRSIRREIEPWRAAGDGSVRVDASVPSPRVTDRRMARAIVAAAVDRAGKQPG